MDDHRPIGVQSFCGAGASMPSLHRVGEACFQQLEAHIASGRPLKDEHLSSLQLVYGKNFGKALQIVDERGVACYVGESSGRKVFQVRSKTTTSEHYTVFPAHYCSCQAFFYDVVCKDDALACKHQIAARLSHLLGHCSPTVLPDLDIADLLMHGIT